MKLLSLIGALAVIFLTGCASTSKVEVYSDNTYYIKNAEVHLGNKTIIQDIGINTLQRQVLFQDIGGIREADYDRLIGRKINNVLDGMQEGSRLCVYIYGPPSEPKVTRVEIR